MDTIGDATAGLSGDVAGVGGEGLVAEPGIGTIPQGLSNGIRGAVMSHRLYALQDFSLAYFHPDWALDDPTSLDVVQRFQREATETEVQDVIRDLDQILGEEMTKEALHDHVLSAYSLFYDPWKDELPIREWLTRVRQVLTGDGG